MTTADPLDFPGAPPAPSPEDASSPAAPSEPFDPHAPELSGSEARLGLGRPAARTLRAGPIVAVGGGVLGTAVLATALALQPSSPKADKDRSEQATAPTATIPETIKNAPVAPTVNRVASPVHSFSAPPAAAAPTRTSSALSEERAASPVVGLDSLNFHYTIQIVAGSPAWTPLQAFDDGKRTFIRFPPGMLLRESPALFVLRDKQTEIVNYWVKGDIYVVDRLLGAAELRVGQQDQEIVRIVRGDPVAVRTLTRPIHGRY